MGSLINSVAPTEKEGHLFYHQEEKKWRGEDVLLLLLLRLSYFPSVSSPGVAEQRRGSQVYA